MKNQIRGRFFGRKKAFLPLRGRDSAVREPPILGYGVRRGLFEEGGAGAAVSPGPLSRLFRGLAGRRGRLPTFRQMLAAAGLEHNRSRFIVKRLFAERFEVIRRDPSKVEFLTRLNDLYFQFQRVGNNYNQVVRAINSHFSNVSIPRQIAALEQHTRELKALSIEILNLTKQAEGWLRI